MKTPILTLLIFGLLLASTVTVVGADLSPDDVRNAMNLGIRYLKTSQNPNGTWSEYSGQTGGITALCTLALLNAGEGPQEPQVKKALDYLRKLRPTTTYVVSLQTMVLCRGTPVDDQLVIGRNVQWLEDAQLKSGPADRKGGWSYGMVPTERSVPGDASNSQFALLALYEAARVAETGQISLTIRRETWERVRTYWINNQIENSSNGDNIGSWGYYKPMNGTGSMTCAGIVSLVIAGDVLHEPDARVTGNQIDGCYRAPSEDQDRIDKGIDWLRRHFTVQANPPTTTTTTFGSRLWHYYYLYGLERAGRLTARRKIGEYDWYREGARYLVQTIGTVVSRSSWKGSGHAEDNEDIATSLALLFLSKGRWPVLMAKVQYRSQAQPQGRDIGWNRHRSDVGNLTIYVESQWRRELTWQVIDLSRASVDDLLQVPVLFFSGGGNPLPESEEGREKLAANLRDYIDRGGFIFADGDSCSSEFDKPFRQLMELVFQKPEYRFKPLDASHPIWIADQKIPPDQARLLLGIDYGCRTSVVYAPSNPPGDPKPSLACLWELSRGGQRASYSPAVQEKIQGGLAIGINVLAYATNREFKEKDLIPETVVIKGPTDKVQRGKFAVAKLQHPGGCDAAPRALANLMEQASHDLNIRVEAHPKLIAMQDPALFDYPVVFMHGRNVFRLTDGERQALREYVERGGLLFADAICGNEAFAESFRREMGLIFPKNRLENISPRDPIWTNKYGGSDLTSVMRRDPQPDRPGEPLKSTLRRVPLELKGVRFGDRYGVIFSEFDLSCALEKHDSMECRGYTRTDAARIGLNVLRYGMQQ
ncbi:MAG: DUF4159 domain-containing protein [Planctomycetota bacterium]